jgi:hypothetical protein
LADILEGYFPYILKIRYPNGTLLKALDRTDSKFDPEMKEKNLLNLDENALKPMSKEEFL